MDGNGTITAVVLDTSGSGYSTAPGVTIRNGTAVRPRPAERGRFAGDGVGEAGASTSIVLDTFGTGYTKPPTVDITDPTGTGATATAAIDTGGVVSIAVTKPGSGYVLPGGIRKFVDGLPGLGPAGANNLGQYIPVAVADTTTFPAPTTTRSPRPVHREDAHGSAARPSCAATCSSRRRRPWAATTPCRAARFGVDRPHFLGPTIVAQKDRPVRITFVNLLPTGTGGDLFLPVDSTMMGSGMGEMDMPWDPAPTIGGTVIDEARNPMCTDE